MHPDVRFLFKITGDIPYFSSSPAQASPEIPAPIIATFIHTSRLSLIHNRTRDGSLSYDTSRTGNDSES